MPSHKVYIQKHDSYISPLRWIFTFEFHVHRPQYHHSLENFCIRYMCSIFFWKLIQPWSLYNISQQLLAPPCLISRSIDWQRQERLLLSPLQVDRKAFRTAFLGLSRSFLQQASIAEPVCDSSMCIYRIINFHI